MEKNHRAALRLQDQIERRIEGSRPFGLSTNDSKQLTFGGHEKDYLLWPRSQQTLPHTDLKPNTSTDTCTFGAPQENTFISHCKSNVISDVARSESHIFTESQISSPVLAHFSPKQPTSLLEAEFSPKQLIGLENLKVDALGERRERKERQKNRDNYRLNRKEKRRRTSQMQPVDLVYPMHQMPFGSHLLSLSMNLQLVDFP